MSYNFTIRPVIRLPETGKLVCNTYKHDVYEYSGFSHWKAEFCPDVEEDYLKPETRAVVEKMSPLFFCEHCYYESETFLCAWFFSPPGQALVATTFDKKVLEDKIVDNQFSVLLAQKKEKEEKGKRLMKMEKEMLENPEELKEKMREPILERSQINVTVAKTPEELNAIAGRLAANHYWEKLIRECLRIHNRMSRKELYRLHEAELLKNQYLRRLRMSNWVSTVNSAILDCIKNNIRTDKKSIDTKLKEYQLLLKEMFICGGNERDLIRTQTWKELVEWKKKTTEDKPLLYIKNTRDGFKRSSVVVRVFPYNKDAYERLQSLAEDLSKDLSVLNLQSKVLPVYKTYRGDFDELYDRFPLYRDQIRESYSGMHEDEYEVTVMIKRGLTEIKSSATTTWLGSQISRLMDLMNHDSRQDYIGNKMFCFPKAMIKTGEDLLNDEYKVSRQEAQKIYSKYERQFRRHMANLKTFEPGLYQVTSRPNKIYYLYVNFKFLYSIYYGRSMYFKNGSLHFKCLPEKSGIHELPFETLEIKEEILNKYPLIGDIKNLNIDMADIEGTYKAVIRIFSDK